MVKSLADESNLPHPTDEVVNAQRRFEPDCH